MVVNIKDLRKLYAERKNEKDILKLEELQFVPGYLKYLIEYVENEIEYKRSDGNISLTPPPGGYDE